METDGDKKKSRPPLGDIGNTQGQMSPEQDIKNMKFKIDVLEGALECQAKVNVVSEQRRKKLKQAEVELKKVKEDITESDALHQKDLADLEEMRKMKEELEAANKAKEMEIVALKKREAEARAALRKEEVDREMHKAFLKAKDELLEEIAVGLKNSDKDQVRAAAFRALCASLQAAKSEQHQEIEALKKKEADALKKEADARAALRKKEVDHEMDKAFLKAKNELLEEIAVGLKNSDKDQVKTAALRALCASLETAKNNQHQIELERDEALQGRQAALKQRQVALDKLDDAERRHEAYVAAHLDDMGRLLRG